MLLIVLLLEYVHCRVIGQAASSTGASVMAAYLDSNNDRMWKSTMFTRAEVDKFRAEGQLVLSILTQVNYSSCPMDASTGVVICGSYTLFPFAVLYSLIKDTKYPDRQYKWLAMEFGLIAMHADSSLAQTSRLVYVNPDSFGEREIFSSLTLRVCAHDNVSTTLLLPSGMSAGTGNTVYVTRGDKTMIASIFDVK